jgi:hypothetical protein
LSSHTNEFQMALEDPGACAAQPGARIVALGVGDVPQMLALTSATQPGPFGPRTIELGHYIGIRRGGVPSTESWALRFDGGCVLRSSYELRVGTLFGLSSAPPFNLGPERTGKLVARLRTGL